MTPEQTGIWFTNSLAESRSLTNHVLLNGSGVAAGDIDGDGWCDLYFCGLDGRNALYRNLGNWRFQDITEEAGVACEGLDATGAVFADVDGDGHLDLLVSSIHQGVHLFLNDGHGHFHDVTSAAGLASRASSMSMALADIDGDGALDLYVANYRSETMRDAFRMRIQVQQVGGKPVVTRYNGRSTTDPDLVGRFSFDAEGNLVENGEVDFLYHNDGHGYFTLIPFDGGAFLDEDGRPLKALPFDWGLSAMFRDLNGDGAPDLYVCNDLNSPDRIWINDGRGHFRAAPRTSVRKTSWFSMGIDFADLNRDGYDDFMVTDMVSRHHRLRQVQVSNHQPVFSPVGVFTNRPQTPRNTLFLNLGDGDFTEVAYYAGLDATEWSWAPVFLDVDLDGYEDLLVVTGFERDVQDIDIAQRLEMLRRSQRQSDAAALQMRRQFPRLALPKLAFRNRGDLTFEESSATWGFDAVGVSQGMALADLDNDGALDLIINNLNDRALLYRNNSSAPRLGVRLRGQPPNTRGIGARIRVTGGPVPGQTQEMIDGGRYLSCDDMMRTFAAGNPTNMLEVYVAWRSGRRSHVTARADQVIEISEPSDAPKTNGVAAPDAPPLFVPALDAFSHRHVENDFNDWERQPLLPKKMSQLGPGVSWLDVDQDGWDDLVIASGRGGTMGIFRNDHAGHFEPLRSSVADAPVIRDQTAVLGWLNASNEMVLLAGSASYEEGKDEGACVRQYNLARGVVEDALPPLGSSAGPLVLFDADGDGQLDLFVGGRVVPGRYPEQACSRLFHRRNGKWVEDEQFSATFKRVGLVSGAVASDLDGDGFPELVLACEWGAIEVWHNEQGHGFTNVTDKLGLGAFRGWWNGVTTGDFDGDGRLDIVASNWGQNSKYEKHRSKPLRLYYGDFNGAGGSDLLEAYFDEELGKYVPWMHLGRIAPALSFVQARFGSFRKFGEASIEEILGEQLSRAQILEANWLQSTLFLNRGDHFEAHPLPVDAQLAPAFAVVVADANGDGAEDLFLSQNFFATEPETDRYDGGRGLWLLGDGRGGFRSMPAKESGVRVYGEQRGAAVADYDRDGRVDLVVTQNGAETCLFRNVGAKPGLRVQLHGPSGNPLGIGSLLRLQCAGRLGPARELHAGSGYWSQDSAVTVLSTPAAPEKLVVRWPGGKLTTNVVADGAQEMRIDWKDPAVPR